VSAEIPTNMYVVEGEGGIRTGGASIEGEVLEADVSETAGPLPRERVPISTGETGTGRTKSPAGDVSRSPPQFRRPSAGLVAHSDRGSQYTSLVYTDRLDELGIAPRSDHTETRDG